MSGVLRQRLDLHGLGARAAIVAESLPVCELPRLAALLDDDDGVIETELQFKLDDDDRVVIDGRLAATLSMRCQRCLEPVAVAVDQVVEAVQQRVGDESSGLETRYECVVEPGPYRLADLVEEELLLGLPLVAVHEPATACGPLAARFSEPVRTDTADEVRTPFEVLKNLRRERR